MTVVRALHPYEQLCSNMNIAVALTIECSTSSLHPSVFYQALDLVAYEHPYLRMTIEPTATGSNFCERKEGPFVKLDVHYTLEDPGVVLNRLVNSPKPGDNATVQAIVQIHKLAPNSVSHVFLLFNHGGIDAPGAFHVAHSLCNYLCQLLNANADVKAIQSTAQQRDFVDILERIPDKTPSSSKPEVPVNFLPPLTAVPKEERDPSALPHISGRWFDLSEDQTTALLANCKAYEASVQGVVSAAAIIARSREYAMFESLNSAHGASEIDSTPLLVQAPANMRQSVDPPVSPEDCVCASAGLWWPQTLKLDQKLWQVAAEATAAVRKELENKSGIEWWKRLQYEMWAPPVTVQASNVGICPVKASYSNGHVRVKAVQMLGGSYGAGSMESAGTMTHAYTFDGKLQLECAAAQPGTGEERAARFAEMQYKVLTVLTGEASARLTVEEALSL